MREPTIKEVIKFFRQYKDDVMIESGIVGAKRYKVREDVRIRIILDPFNLAGEEDYYNILTDVLIERFFPDLTKAQRDRLVARLLASKTYREFIKREIGIPDFVTNLAAYLKALRQAFDE